jgi:hypothetical protein
MYWTGKQSCRFNTRPSNIRMAWLLHTSPQHILTLRSIRQDMKSTTSAQVPICDTPTDLAACRGYKRRSACSPPHPNTQRVQQTNQGLSASTVVRCLLPSPLPIERSCSDKGRKRQQPPSSKSRCQAPWNGPCRALHHVEGVPSVGTPACLNLSDRYGCP